MVGEGSYTAQIQGTKSTGGFCMSHRLAFTGPGELCKGLVWCSRGDGPPAVGFNASGPVFKAGFRSHLSGRADTRIRGLSCSVVFHFAHCISVLNSHILLLSPAFALADCETTQMMRA